MMLLRTVRWPSGGRETTVGILDQKTAKPFAEDLSARIVMTPPDGIKGTAKARKVSLDPGYTAILLPPDQTTTDRATLAQAILAFVAGRPPTEGIALYRHGSGIQLFSNFQEDRSELKEALDRYKSGTSDATPLASAIAIATLVTELKDVGGSGPDVMRTLVVLAKDPKTIDTAPTDVFVTAVTPDATGLGAAAAAIDDLRKNAFYKVGVCSVEDKVAVSFKVDKMKGSLPASLPPTLPEEKGGTCSVDAIDSMKRAFTPRIELVFDDDQRAAHAVRVQATQAGTFDEVLAKSDFQTGVRLAPGQPVQTARAHLHGQSSLRCARKHYVLQLDGPARHLMPDSATDEFILISLCDDPAYVYSPTAYTLMRPDLFVPRRRFVELVIDGTTRGIYMLMEKPREEMVRDSTRVSTVMRRGYPVAGADAFDVNYPNTGDLTLPVQRYNAFKATFMGLSGAALVAALRNQMDLDQYVRFLASQSILQSGDYIDELYYIGAEQADGKGGTHERYRFMMWDAEGYSACHAGGANAWVDPDQLAYCAEA
jgi:hypothetical protein